MDTCDKPEDNDDDDGTMSVSGVGIDPSQVPASTQGLEEWPQRSPDIGAIGRPDSPSTTLFLFIDSQSARQDSSLSQDVVKVAETVRGRRQRKGEWLRVSVLGKAVKAESDSARAPK